MIYGKQSSPTLFVYYTLVLAASTFTFTSVVRFPGSVWRQDQFVIYTLYYAVLLAEFVLQCWADQTPTYVDITRKLQKPTKFSITFTCLSMFQSKLRGRVLTPTAPTRAT